MDIDDIHNFINNISTSSLNTNLGKLIVLENQPLRNSRIVY